MAHSTHHAPAAPSTPQSFLHCLGQFLTPQVWKQAQRAAPHRRTLRWRTHPLILVLLCMSWCAGDSLPERFETARAFYVALHQRRRRPGQTFAGFEKALAHLPMPVLRALAAALRGRLARLFAGRLRVDGFIPLGCDGSRLACPRSGELERRLGGRGTRTRRGRRHQAPGAPPLWVTAVLHLGLGVLWSWRLGTGRASERDHLRRLIGTLPHGALLVADAGYVGYELMAALQAAGLVFLLRLSSRAPLYVPDKSTLQEYCEGLVYYWPQKAQKNDRPPLLVRLWRIRGGKGPVCLITNVLDECRLPRRTASKFYRWRWRNDIDQEGCRSSDSLYLGGVAA